jgi:DTW domain-containing protein YfiP
MSVCVCAFVTPLQTKTRVLILQHPRERHVPINTVRLARLCLPDATMRRGVELDADPVVADVLAGRGGWPTPYVLYPGASAMDLAVERPPGPITLIVLDGTWWQARKLLRRNPGLEALPQLRLAPATPSRYRIRREPHEHCVATIEALALALRALDGDAADADARYAALLAPFDAMVERQLSFARDVGDARHLRAAVARGPRSARRAQIPALEELRAAAGELVCVHGEANAWSVRVAERPAPEIVHWLAWRVSTGETFRAVIAPRARLAPGTPVQIGLSRELLAAGETWEAFRARWAAFVRPADALCSWGHFPTATLASGGVPLPERRFDARVAASGLLGARVGTAEDCARRLDEVGPLSPRSGERETEWSGEPGRAGRRMAALARVVTGLLRPAAESSGA